ncbi:phytanoyl-CoA dioxygenase family protein [Kordiimonas sp.]|uniref:phytanoyl-CoA dioxygenase family protein n=1 Tax=Kordiimonas sp. TaxID=1970157 RepID=UPI003A919722
MIPRFDARDFTGITPEMREAFERDGVLVLDGLINPEICDGLMNRMAELVEGFDATEHKAVFSSKTQAHTLDLYQYFLDSGFGTHFFFEEEAFNEDGELTKPLPLALNKVGHAMHDLDPVFDHFARQDAFKLICEGLDQKEPLPLQSMYIFKQPQIGGEVVCHQDATYLRTEPNSCLGLWVALEDATEENGCLWGIPGGHKTGGLRSVFRRKPDDDGTLTEVLNEAPFEEDKKVPLPAPQGTVLVFGGLFPHMSSANRSNKSRHAYTLHVVDGAAEYPADNWLRRPEYLPLRGFNA